MKYSRPRGTQDIIPPETSKWRHVEEVFTSVFESCGYKGIRTPIFEMTELFERAVGEDTDIITKEMYTFSDRGGRSLTLRPENTASVVRAYLENGMHRLGGIIRLYYGGPMFRYEKPQAGRFRQFHQVGVEAIGSRNALVDVEIMDIVLAALEKLGFKGLSVKINSVGCSKCRPVYRKKLRSALQDLVGELCNDCSGRLDKNPLRIFDCKRCVDIKARLPEITAHLCGECSEHFDRVTAGLQKLGRLFDRDPLLVRGLDYYTKTTFEIIHTSLGAQNALCGGGRYDDLIEECGGPPTPAVGFSAGLERIISVLPKESTEAASLAGSPEFYVVCADDQSSIRALEIARILRRTGGTVADLSLRSMKKQMRGAEKTGARFAVIVQNDPPGSVQCRDLAAREQQELRDDELETYLKRKMHKVRSDSN